MLIITVYTQEYKSLLQCIVSCIVYYLSVFCVARYKNILDFVEKEQSDLSPQSKERSFSLTESPLVTESDEYNELSQSPDVAMDRYHYSHSDSVDDGTLSIASASELRDNNEKSMSVQFFGTEGALQPSTVIPLNHAIDVSEQV